MKDFTVIWEKRWMSGSHMHCLTKKQFVRAETIHSVMKSEYGEAACFVFEGHIPTIGEIIREEDILEII